METPPPAPPPPRCRASPRRIRFRAAARACAARPHTPAEVTPAEAGGRVRRAEGASSRWFRSFRIPASGAKAGAVGEEEAGPGAAAEGKAATGSDGRASEGGRVPRRGSGPAGQGPAVASAPRAPRAVAESCEVVRVNQRRRCGSGTRRSGALVQTPGPRAPPARAPAGLLLPSRPPPAGARRPRPAVLAPGPRRRGCDQGHRRTRVSLITEGAGRLGPAFAKWGSGSPVSSRAGGISRAGEREALGPVPATESLSPPPRPSDGAGVQWRSVAKCLCISERMAVGWSMNRVFTHGSARAVGRGRGWAWSRRRRSLPGPP